MAGARVPKEGRDPGRSLTKGPCASGARPLPLPRAALTSAVAGVVAVASPWGTGWIPSAWAATGTTLPPAATPRWEWCYVWMLSE